MVGLAFIWLSIPQSYPFTLFPYLLLLFLPGYALITLIKPHDGLVVRVVIGFLLSLLILLCLPVVFRYLNLTFLDGLLPTLLLLMAILFSLVAILRRHRISTFKNLDDEQPSVEDSISRMKEILKKAKVRSTLSEEIRAYYPQLVEEFAVNSSMSVMLIYDNTQRIETAKKSPKEEKVKEKKPIRAEILHPNEQEKSGERTIPLSIGHPIKREDLLSDFQSEMAWSVWHDRMNHDQSGFRNWDLLLALLLSGIAIIFSYDDPMKTPILTFIASYALVLCTVTYTLLVVIFPGREKIGFLYRIMVSLPYAILLLVLVLIFGSSNMITSLPLPLILLFALATVLLVMLATLRRKYLPAENAELSSK